MVVLWSFCVLMICQLLGDITHVSLGVPVPGTVIGLGFLLGWLCIAGQKGGGAMVSAADALLPYLSLFFVPPGVAAVLRLSPFHAAWLPIGIAIAGSSILAMATAGLTAQALLRRQEASQSSTSDLKTLPEAPRP